MKNKATLISSQGIKGLSLTSDADWVRSAGSSASALRVLPSAKLYYGFWILVPFQGRKNEE